MYEPMRWSCFLNVAPVAKGRPRHGKGFTYTPTKTRDAEAMIAGLVSAKNPVRFKGPLYIKLIFNLLKPKSAKFRKYPEVRPDLDNYEKLVLDALNGICYDDDSQIVSKTSEKRYSDRIGISIEIKTLPLEREGPTSACSHG